MLRIAALVVALLALAPAAPAAAGSLGALRFFAEPGPPPAAGPDPIAGGCHAARPGDASIGTTPCSPAPALDAPEALALSPDGRHAYVASALGDTVTAFARDADTGRLTPVEGGCLSQAPREGCTTARALDGADGVAVAPDGSRVYVTSLVSDAVAVLHRDADTGALTQPDGPDGCVSEGGLEGCAAGRALDHAAGVVVAPDGARVYVAARRGDGVAVLERTEAGLAQPEGAAGCVQEAALAGCADGEGLDGAYGLALHGDTLHVAARVADAVVHLRRDAQGQLAQAGCTSRAALGACAVGGAGLDGVTSVAVSPDGRHLYTAAYASYAVAAFAREDDGRRLAPLGCLSEQREAGRCTPARALLYAHAVAVSPDGRSVYVAAADANAIAVLHRDPGTGAVGQVPAPPGRTWTDGCLSWRGHAWAGATDLSAADHSDHACARSLALYYPSDLAVSGDGRHVYAVSAKSDAVAALPRLAEGEGLPPGSATTVPPAPEPPPAPVPPPPGRDPVPAPPPPPPPDRTAPTVTLTVPARATLGALRRPGLAVGLRTGEPATVTLTLRSGTRVLARRALRADAYPRTLRLRAVLRRVPRTALRLTVVARDGAGNARTTTRAVRVRRR